MVGRIGGRISVMTEWLGKQQILDGFLRQFQTKAGGTSTRRYRTTQNCKMVDCITLTFSVYISCLYSVFITAAQMSRPTRQRLDAFVVCTPQQTLRVLFTRSTWLSGTATRYGYSSSSKSTTTLSIFFRNTTSLHPPQQLHSTINSDNVHSPHCRCLIRPVHLIDSNFITRLLFVTQCLRSECIIPYHVTEVTV